MTEKLNIRKIAELASCSASTVSRVIAGKQNGIKISDNTREKILNVCYDLDYHPSIHASRLFSNRAYVIGFLTPGNLTLEDDNLARSMSTVYFELCKHNYRLLPIVYNDYFLHSSEYLNLFKRREIDALIIWGASSEKKWIDELHEHQYPFILQANRCGDYPAVVCDDLSGSARLVEHCLAKGARKFLYVTATDGDSCLRRQKGYFDVLKGYDASFINGGISIGHGLNIVPQILELRPDAVICGNDRVAIGVEIGLLKAGIRIPQDIMITGADNIELSQYCPVPLSTFDWMSRQCAGKCVEIMMAHLHDKTPLCSAVVQPEVIIRQSA